MNVSIVVITMNEEENIKTCLDSLRSLDYAGEIEIIVVDSSTDNTPGIARAYKNVKVIQTEKQGFAKARNTGIKHSKFPFIAFTDADCIVPKDWLSTLMPYFKKQDIAGVGGNAYPPANTGFFGRCVACLGIPAGGSIGLDACINFSNGNASALVTCNAVFRKEILQEIKGFSSEFKYGGEDTNLSDKIRAKNYKLLYVKPSYVFHKPRISFSEFFKWHTRRGKADFFLHKPSFLKLIINPSSIVFLGIFILIILFFIFYSIFLAILIIIFFYLVLIVGMLSTKRYQYLVRRRNRANLNNIVLLFIIPILFYIRRLLINTAQLKVKLFGT